MSRVEKVAKNMKFAVICQLTISLVNFLLRKIFVVYLGEEYLGLNGLFTDILSMLSLAELGFGASIVFSLYKPLAYNDTGKVKSLMHLYQTIYRLVGLFVLVAGVLITPKLDFFVKEMPDIPCIQLIYILNVVNSAMSYFFIYKASLLLADQNKYVELSVNTIAKSACAAVQIIILLIFKNYILYLIVQVVFTLAQNIAISVAADKRYPYLKEKNIKPLEKEDMAQIKQNVGAMIFHKVGSVIIFGTDSILMAKFVSVAAVGIYSNYILIRRVVVTIIEAMFNGLSASFGNLNALENEEKRYDAFKNIMFFSSWLFGFVCICLLELYNPFITLWLGEEYIFTKDIVWYMVIYFYMFCMRMPVNTSKEAMGFFKNDKYKPLFEIVINLVASIYLARTMGIAGVILGTIISMALVPLWVEPLVIYRHGFKKNVADYFARYFIYTLVTLIAWFITNKLCIRTTDGFMGFVLKMIVCCAVPNLIFLVAYFKTKEFAYLKDIGLRMLNKLLKK